MSAFARRVVLVAAGAILAAWTAGDGLVRATGSIPGSRPETAVARPASIYALDLELIDQDGRLRALGDLRGRPVVATMLYTACVSVCPTVTTELKKIERRLPDRLRETVTFAVFSLDPGRDTPAALRAFGAGHGLDPDSWQLFAATPAGVRMLSVVLGVNYRPAAGGEIAHSAVVVAIDRDGVVRFRQAGLGRGAGPLLRALEGMGP